MVICFACVKAPFPVPVRPCAHASVAALAGVPSPSPWSGEGAGVPVPSPPSTASRPGRAHPNTRETRDANHFQIAPNLAKSFPLKIGPLVAKSVCQDNLGYHQISPCEKFFINPTCCVTNLIKSTMLQVYFHLKTSFDT